MSETLFLSGTCLFLAIAAILYHYTKNLIIPFVGWMMLVGVAYNIAKAKLDVLNSWPPLTLSPDIVMHLLVPLLVFETGRKFRIRDFDEEKYPILFFAFIGSIITAFAIGLPIAWLMDIPWQHGFLLGSILAATDPVAVNAIIAKIALPKHLKVQMEGESIFNDAIGVLLFTMAFGIAIENHEVSPDNAIFYFLNSLGTGMLVGTILGWLVATLLNTWKENELAGTLLTLSLAIAASIITETLFEASGIIGALFAALVFMRTERSMDKKQWVTFDNFWDQVAVVANSVLFFLLGSTLALVSFHFEWMVVAAIGLMMVSRAVIIYGGGAFFHVIKMRIPLSWLNILYLGGVRGAISVALLLTVPETYAHREEFLMIVFVLILFTLLVHPILIRWYLSKTTLDDDDALPHRHIDAEEKYDLQQNEVS